MENPFVVTGVIKPEYFCDRVEESDRLVRTVTGGANLVVVSQRRVGKTGLVRHCFERPEIKGRYVTLFVDILRTSSLNELVYMLGQAVFGALASRGQRWAKAVAGTLRSLNGCFGYDALTGIPTFDVRLGDIRNPEFTLEEIFHCIAQAEQHCIVAIDEFQQITSYQEKNIEALLRTYIQHCSNANFIFAGSERHLLDEMFLETARPFYNSADMMNLEPIRLPVYEQFVVSHFERCGRRVEREAVEYVYGVFEGNTYYDQKVFREAFSLTAEGELFTAGRARDVVATLLLDNDRRYAELMSRLSLPQKELLYAIASDGRSQQLMSMAFIKRHGLRSASSVQSAVKKLADYGLVSSEHGQYFVADPLFRLWMTQ